MKKIEYNELIKNILDYYDDYFIKDLNNISCIIKTTIDKLKDQSFIDIVNDHVIYI